MTIITLIRHAESRYNAGQYTHVSETTDTPLTERGKRQASKLSGDYDLLIVSPLRRTLQTVEYSRITANNVMVEPLVRETLANHPSNHLEGETLTAETYLDVMKRVALVIELLCEAGKYHQTIVIVSHGGFLSHLVEHLTGHPHFFRNASSFVMEFPDDACEKEKHSSCCIL